jgi:4-hydroxymandelate oxidase
VAAEDYAPHARARMGEAAWAYVDGGAADGRTMADNLAAFARLKLNAAVLADMAGAHTGLTLFGQAYRHPILVAPTAFHRLLHPEAELATATGARAMQAGLVVSAQASTALEPVAALAGGDPSPWFQLYVQPDRAFTLALLRRAEAAGYGAIVVTVDASASLRNAEQRAGFRLPPGVEAVNLRGMAPPAPPEGTDGFALLRDAPTWADIATLRAATRLPLLLKGIMTAADARRALAAGADGIVVSNHGGRALDDAPASIEALPAIAAEVAGRVPLLLDGGIRRGTDVLKALALGASAVLVGRPVLHGLAVAGAAGVAHVLGLLRTELEIAMVQTGCPRLADIGPAVLWRAA